MRMRYSVPTTWEDSLVGAILHKDVEEVYGKLSADFVGGGRPSAFLPHINKQQACLHIKQVHQHGLKFNYLLNGVCLDNKEFTRSGQRKLFSLLDWVTSVEADSVTVSIPYLLELIKKHYTQFKVYVSTYAHVDSVEKAKYWEDLGADLMTLSSAGITRNFNLLRKIKQNVKCKVQLFANNSCLYNCPLVDYHACLLSHSSQEKHSSNGFLIDYCRLSCMYSRLANPTNFVRAEWIRPEDIHYYEEIGIDRMKILDRLRKKEVISLIVQAYVNQKFEGNLMELLFAPQGGNSWERKKASAAVKYFFRPFSVNVFELKKSTGLENDLNKYVYIDNQALDNFLGYFLDHDCRLIPCQECGYCSKAARKAVIINKDWQKKSIKKYEYVLEALNNSKIFKY